MLGRLCREDRGLVLAEFLVVAPLLLLILMATVGFGHLIFTKMVVLQAANRAARLGAVLYGDSDTPRSVARSETRAAALKVLSAGLSGSDRGVTIDQSGEDLSVTVWYRADTFVPLLGSFLGSAQRVEHEAVYRVERDTVP